jgi:hypothetical protein
VTHRRAEPRRGRLTRALLVVGALCGTVTGTALAQDDVLVLRNGDRLTGTLVGVDDGTWTFRHAGGDLKLPWALRWTPAVEDLEDYRLLSDAGLSTNLFKGVGFRIGSRNQYNNRPPVGIEKHDWLLTFNLTYAIGG